MRDTPGVVAERLGSHLSIPGRTLATWRRHGATAAETSLRRDVAGQAARAEASVRGAGALSERLLRFTTVPGVPLLAADVRRDGLQATAERHTYDAVQLAPELLLGGAGRAARVAAIEKAADAQWIASAPNRAQAARLAEEYALLEAWGGTHRLIAGPEATVFRKAGEIAHRRGGTSNDYAKWATPKVVTVDGRIVETHWVQDLRSGKLVESKRKLQGWARGVPRR